MAEPRSTLAAIRGVLGLRGRVVQLMGAIALLLAGAGVWKFVDWTIALASLDGRSRLVLELELARTVGLFAAAGVLVLVLLRQTRVSAALLGAVGPAELRLRLERIAWAAEKLGEGHAPGSIAALAVLEQSVACDPEIADTVAAVLTAQLRGPRREGDQVLRERMLRALASPRSPMRSGPFDLRGADLSGVNLAHAVLAAADLGGAKLARSRLAAADLRGADLRGADLSDVHLAAARLDDADLSASNLRGATLVGAFLGGVKFDKADLSGADLMGALDLTAAQLATATTDGATRASPTGA